MEELLRCVIKGCLDLISQTKGGLNYLTLIVQGICALPLTFWRKSHSNSYIGCLMIAFFFQINAMNATTEAACLIGEAV